MKGTIMKQDTSISRTKTLRQAEKVISELNKKLDGSELHQEHTKLQEKFRRLKNAHQHSLSYHQKRKRTYITPSCNHAETIKAKDEEILQLQHEKLILQEEIEMLKQELETAKQPISLKQDGKTYSAATRMMTYDFINANAPMSAIPKLLVQAGIRAGGAVECGPKRTCVEGMVRELGALAEFQASEALYNTPDATLGFDATTQEGIHVNALYITTTESTLAIAMDELAGGTAEDYFLHVTSTIDHLATIFLYFNDDKTLEFIAVKQQMIDNIRYIFFFKFLSLFLPYIFLFSNTMSDRCAANKAALRLLEEEWNKPLNKLFCHVHPLDTIASTCRQVLHKLETEKGRLFGNDCIAGNTVLAVSACTSQTTLSELGFFR